MTAEPRAGSHALPLTAALLTAALLSGACGPRRVAGYRLALESEGRTTLAFEVADPEHLDRAAEVLEERLREAELGFGSYRVETSPPASLELHLEPSPTPDGAAVLQAGLARLGELRLLLVATPEEIEAGVETETYPARRDGRDVVLLARPPGGGRTTEAHLARTYASENPGGFSGLALVLEPDQRKAFHELTRESAGRDLAVVVDREVITAPTIIEGLAGPISIHGFDSEQEIFQVRVALGAGPLPGELRAVEIRRD